MSAPDAAARDSAAVDRSPRGGFTRRDFIRVSAAAGGGLLVYAAFPWAGSGAEATPAIPTRMGVFVAVDTDGGVLVTIPVPEIGQGVRTSLAMLVAEELDVPWDRVRVTQADASDDMGPFPRAAGSHAVRGYWTVLREAGATARAMLVATAAARWGVEASTLVTRDGEVRRPGTRQSLGYGELAAEAALRTLPSEVTLKDPSQYRIIGTPRNHLDTPAIVRGETTFGLDVRVTGMLRAAILRAPTYGGTVEDVDDSQALAVPGVHSVIRLGGQGSAERPGVQAGVAVLADRTWTALRARDLLRVRWGAGPNADESTDRLHAECAAALGVPGSTHREAEDVDRALAAAERRVRADYHAPLMVHAPMEPPNCVVHVRGDRCEIWAPTQVPIAAWARAASLLGIPRENVTLHVIRSGGGFGRRLDQDFVVEAVAVAKEAGAPVQVVWTREDDLRHGFYRPFSYHRMEAGVDGRGRVTAWLHRQAGTSRYAFRQGVQVGASEFRAGTYPAALIPAHRLEYTLVESNLPRGPLRAPGLNAATFVTESFLDEVAHAAGRDPLELRLDLLTGDRELPEDRDDPVFSTRRMRGVLEAAAEGAGWGTTLPAGRGRGVACGFTFGSYCAHVVEASVDAVNGRIRVHRVVSAIDAGRAVNPNGIRAQVEGGVIDGIGAALLAEITVEEGRVVQSNFHDYPLLRFPDAPAVEVIIIEGADGPTGVGEPPYPPIFPALANAVFAASGARVRQLPMRPDRVLAALAARSGGA